MGQLVDLAIAEGSVWIHVNVWPSCQNCESRQRQLLLRTGLADGARRYIFDRDPDYVSPDQP